MKKRLIALLLVLGILFLCGCRGKTSDYEEPENRLYISALGFDRRGEKISVCAEAISIADNTSGDEYTIKHYEGEGDGVESAMYEMTKNLAPAVNLSHCALVTVGENMVGEHLNEIILYCFEDREITQSIQLISADNAKELLQYNKESTKPLGFQISELLAADTDGIGVNKRSTLISVMNALDSAEDCFYLPYFEVENKNFLFSGAKLYKGGSDICKLSRTEMQLLKIAENDFHGGELKLDTEDKSRVLKISSANASSLWDDSEEAELKLKVKIKTEGTSKTTSEIKNRAEKEIAGLIIGLRDNYSVDVLGIGDLIKKKYKSLSDLELLSLVNDTHITVECSFTEGGAK